jgi:hypothetical protein
MRRRKAITAEEYTRIMDKVLEETKDKKIFDALAAILDVSTKYTIKEEKCMSR